MKKSFHSSDDEMEIKSERSSVASVLKKRTRKESRMAKCDFLDFEAGESDREERKGRRSVKFEDELYKRGKSIHQFVEFSKLTLFNTIRNLHEGGAGSQK